MLNKELQDKIKQHVHENKNSEVCGLILSSGENTFIYRCKNISQNSGKHFELSPFDYLRAWDEGKNKIIGFYHSQQSTKPSVLDIVNYKNHKLPSYIYSHESDEIFEVTDSHLKYNYYLGREFELGKNDCFSLVRDFYKTEYGVSIFNYERKEGWFKNEPKIIEKNYRKEKFVKVNLGDVKDGDIIEFYFGHFAIYLKDNLILHHERNRFSNIEFFSEVWKKRVSNVYRYEKHIN